MLKSNIIKDSMIKDNMIDYKMLRSKMIKKAFTRLCSSLLITSMAFLCMSCAYNSDRIDPDKVYDNYNSSSSLIKDDNTPLQSGVPHNTSINDSSSNNVKKGRSIDFTSSIDYLANSTSFSNIEKRLYNSANIMMVGDILLHMPIEETCLQEDGSYDFSSLFANTSDIISSADLALVNQEVIIGGEELGISGYPCFNAPYQIADALTASGFDVICHATNHALDKGKLGIINTLNYWNTAHPEIVTLGIYDNEEDSKGITVINVNNINIAILNYTYGTNGIPIPKSMPYCVDILDEKSVTNDLDLAEEIADFTIVCPHWGTEYVLEHTSTQEYWSKLFMEHGADLVIGTHPHVIEDIEYYHEDGHDMLCYYSIGNFVSWTSSNGKGVLNRVVGGIANVTIRKDLDGKVYIESYDVIPTVCHLEPVTSGVSVYPLELYTNELALANKITKQDSSFTLDNCHALVEEVWGESCEMKLPDIE